MMGRKEAIGELQKAMAWLSAPAAAAACPEGAAGAQRAVEAARYAAEFMEARPRTGKRNWYYTFGTDAGFPFKAREFVEVRADTLAQADAKFGARFPGRDGRVNCADRYAEDEWRDGVYPEYYAGRRPSLVID